jgi:hypothetical protein
MKFIISAGGRTLEELEEYIIKLKAQGFEKIGYLEHGTFTNERGELVEFFSMDMQRDVYPGLNATQSFNKWIAENDLN